MLERFAGRFEGKTSPVQLFWHSLDLAVTRFSGRRAPPMPGANRVTQEAYSHEVASFGFWAGDNDTREPSFYGYAAPVPEGLRDEPLQPRAAKWSPGSGMARLPYEAVRKSADPARHAHAVPGERLPRREQARALGGRGTARGDGVRARSR